MKKMIISTAVFLFITMGPAIQPLYTTVQLSHSTSTTGSVLATNPNKATLIAQIQAQLNVLYQEYFKALQQESIK